MRLYIVTTLALLCLWMPQAARASSPGGACTVLGAQERDSGQLLICNGSTWVETIQTGNAGRSLFQVAPGSGAWTSYANTDEFTCGINSGSLYCWGEASYYGLGNASTTDQYTPVKIGTASWLEVARSSGATGSNMCGLQSDRRLYCWGGNGYAQVGNGSYVDVQTPTSIAGTNTWDRVVIGQYMNCGIRTNKTLWCWGTEQNGQFGDGGTATNGTSTTPVQIGTALWKRISLGGGHACGIQTNDTLWCWGLNSSGQVGDGTTTGPVLSPVQIGSNLWKEVVAARRVTCGIRDNNTLWCWGVGGEVGDGTGTLRSAPVQIGASLWLSITAGWELNCGIRDNNTLWCWGVNWDESGGQPSSALLNAPTQVGTLTSWTSVYSGDGTTCGTTSDNTLYCWGENISGVLGIGSTTPASTPTPQQVLLTTAPCTSWLTGRLSYTSTNNIWQYCNGTDWVDF